MFIIGIEFLGNEIKGIDIEPGKTVKLAQYADDTTVIVYDDQSVCSLFRLVSQFNNCSGLRMNKSKSEFLWLGSSRQFPQGQLSKPQST